MTEHEVLEAKRLRRAARKVFDTQRDLIKADLGAAGLGSRVMSRIVDDGKMMAETAVETADRHRAVVGAGALALTGWFLRKPIVAFAASVLGLSEVEEQDDAATRPEKATEEA